MFKTVNIESLQFPESSNHCCIQYSNPKPSWKSYFYLYTSVTTGNSAAQINIMLFPFPKMTPKYL